MTAAVGVQPASISALASGPDIPKVKAEVIAKIRPTRNLVVARASIIVMGHSGL
ncbi:hypothetical protein [Mycolicibacterium sp. PDY-3]|uniref:hypothetical protein n=1 Tax=Mycolicibacterium sp. PDY-3 TaxID=3376069 RepID=UPI0037B1ABD8